MKDQSIRIRTARTNNYHACLPLFMSLYHGDIGHGFEQTFEAFVKSKDGVVLLAEHSSKIVGVLMGSYHLDIDWEGWIAKIDALTVDEAFRQTGIGKKLVRYFIDEAKKKGCKAVVSRVNRRNMVAQVLHKNLGFIRANTDEFILDLQEHTI